MTTPHRKTATRPTTTRKALLAPAMAILAVPAWLVPAAAPTVAQPNAIVIADIPMPRPNPLRAGASVITGSTDPIAQFISGVTEEGRRMVEDSDAPQTDFTPVAAAKSPPPAPSSKADINTIGIRYALKFLDDGDPAAATAAAYALPNPVDTKMIDWLVATSGKPNVPASRIAEVWRKLSDWPGQNLLQIRFEEALVREKPPAETVVRAFNGRKPATENGAVLLTRAYQSLGQKSNAAGVIRTYWREARFDAASETKLRKDFGDLLTAADYKARSDRLLYEDQIAAGVRNAGFLDRNEQALAAAVAAVSGRKNAEQALNAVPAAKRSDPLYLYAKAQHLRRAGKYSEAAKVVLSAPRGDPSKLDGDAWWIERRVLSREMLDLGDARTAYQIAAGHAATSDASIAEAEFHAGWYALEFLNDPATARKHFEVIERVSSRPLSQSRALYWLGRAAERAGNRTQAAAYYQRAGRHPTTFYGQLALASLGAKQIPIAAPPKIDSRVRARFEANELVQVIRRLDAANRGDRNDIFYRALADRLSDPAEIALLAEMAEKHGGPQFALSMGKLASYRGLPVDSTAFPTSAIPSAAKTGRVDKAMVYAIARQESAFNPRAVSSAGARGLLQLMPATAKSMAKLVGLPYSESRLTSDPAYNAALGAAFLDKLHASYSGSFVMTFAAYNAGPSRVTAWVQRYGDPRDPDVDVVNWIERIPFTETRNYVQRIMENLQVYRARLGSPALTIHTDLKRGRA